MLSNSIVLPNLKYIFELFRFIHALTLRETRYMFGIPWVLVRNIESQDLTQTY